MSHIIHYPAQDNVAPEYCTIHGHRFENANMFVYNEQIWVCFQCGATILIGSKPKEVVHDAGLPLPPSDKG